MDGAYRFMGQPLQAAMAKSLVLKVLRETSGSLQRVDISDEIQRRHLERGGLPARQATADVIKRALWYLEEEGRVTRAGANGRWRLAGEPAASEDDDRMSVAADEASNDREELVLDAIYEGIVLGVGSETVYLYFLQNDRELARMKGRTV